MGIIKSFYLHFIFNGLEECYRTGLEKNFTSVFKQINNPLADSLWIKPEVASNWC